MISRFVEKHAHALVTAIVALMIGGVFGWLYWEGTGSIYAGLTVGFAGAGAVVAGSLFVYAESLSRTLPPPSFYLSTRR